MKYFSLHTFKRKSDSDKSLYTKPEWKNNTNALVIDAIKWFESQWYKSKRTLVKMKITEGKEFMPQTV